MERVKKFFQHPRALVAISGTLLLVVLVAAVFVWRGRSGIADVSAPVLDDTASSSSSFSDLRDLEELNAFNVLLLGYGGAGHEGGHLTDVIQLVHFDFTNNVLALISIPRDLWVTLPSGAQGKINAAFVAEDTPEYPLESLSLDEALAGAVKTKSVIEDVTGLTPHFFVGIDFGSFQTAIDRLGGVSVDVPEAFSDPWYPVKGRELELCGHTPEEVTQLSNTLSGFELEKQFPCRYEELSFSEGQTEMDGETALKFVRSRHGSTGGDFARAQRQHELLLAVRDAFLSARVFEDPVGVFRDFRSLVQTNLNENLVRNIGPILSGVGQYRVVRINLTTENVLTTSTSTQGAFILTSKTGSWGSVHTYIADQIGATNGTAE